MDRPFDEKIDYEKQDNQELIQSTKNLHGRLYHRINSLQVQVNRLREENTRLRKNSFSAEEVKRMRETFEHALEYLK